MKINKFMSLAPLLITAFLSAGCGQSDKAENPAELVKTSLDHAQELYKESAMAGHAWKKTGDVLAEAKAQFAAGDFIEAQRLADEAIALARASLNQAATEQHDWTKRFPRVSASQKP